jgi:hypothetical protein
MPSIMGGVYLIFQNDIAEISPSDFIPSILFNSDESCLPDVDERNYATLLLPDMIGYSDLLRDLKADRPARSLRDGS